MPPHSSLSPAPTSPGDRPAGRHRAPETEPATAPIPAPRAPEAEPATASIPSPRVAFLDAGGAARHRAGAYESYGSSRAAARRSRAAEAGNTQSRRRSTKDRASSGAHRAPGTVPVEAWFRAAKNRPQVLLGMLVAAGLLLTAVPIPQSGGESNSVMTAAAEAVGVISKPEKKKPEKKAEAESVQALPAATEPSAAPSPPPTSAPAVRPGGKQPEKVVVPAGDGPFDSLRTTGSEVVMLSFDDGPDPEQTPKILALLEKHQVKAVFCLVGTQARRHPDLVRQIAAAGHVLCNHTWSHDLRIGKKKPQQILADLNRTNAAIRAAVPGAEIPYFRAPGGNFTDRLVKTAYGDGMTSLYWEVDPRDWEHPEGETSEQHVKRIVTQVRKETRPGAIVLSHDFNQPDTTTAYAELLPWLVENFRVGVPGAATEPTPAPSAPEPTPSATAPETTPSVTPSASATV